MKNNIDMLGTVEDYKIALLLKGARAMLGLSLKEVGGQLGVTSAGAGKWEAATSPIKASNFSLLNIFYRHHGVEMYIDENGFPTVKANQTYFDMLSSPNGIEITPLNEITKQLIK